MDANTDRHQRRSWLVGLALMAIIGAGLAVSMTVFDESDEPVVVPTSTSAPTPTATTPPIVVGPSSSADDLLRIEATGAAAPWIGVEVCASSPPGCVPVWTSSLAQEASRTVAEVRPPDRFVAPDGVVHQCHREPCELRISTDAATETWPFGEPSDAEPPAWQAGSDIAVVLDPYPVRSGAATSVRIVGAETTERVIIGLCAKRDRDEDCTPVHVDRTDTTGSAAFTLQLSRRIAGVADTTGGRVRTDTDCATQACRLMVTVGGARVVRAIDFDASVPADEDGALRFEVPGPYAPHETVVLRGSGFEVVSPTHSAQARWVVCGERPEALHRLGDICGTPRTLRTGATIAADGTFTVPVTIPAPGSVRTWNGAEPIACADRCWVVVLAGPFPRPVSVPIEIDASGGR